MTETIETNEILEKRTEEIKIPLQLKDWRFTIVERNAKNPIGKKWNEFENTLVFDDEKLLQAIVEGYNYGAVAFGNQIILGADSLEFASNIESELPLTFTILSGSEKGKHFYFETDEPISEKITFPKILGDLIYNGKKQAVCAGSTHPCGNKYRVIRDIPVARISKKALSDFIQKSVENVQTINELTKKIVEKVEKKEIPTPINQRKPEEQMIDFKGMKQGYIDISLGKFNMEEAFSGQDEFAVWNSFYREAYLRAGLTPEQLFPLLRKNQTGFDENNARTQLGYPENDFHQNPFKNETYHRYFDPIYAQQGLEPIIDIIFARVENGNYLQSIKDFFKEIKKEMEKCGSPTTFKDKNGRKWTRMKINKDQQKWINEKLGVRETNANNPIIKEQNGFCKTFLHKEDMEWEKEYEYAELKGIFENIPSVWQEFKTQKKFNDISKQLNTLGIDFRRFTNIIDVNHFSKRKSYGIWIPILNPSIISDVLHMGFRFVPKGHADALAKRVAFSSKPISLIGEYGQLNGNKLTFFNRMGDAQTTNIDRFITHFLEKAGYDIGEMYNLISPKPKKKRVKEFSRNRGYADRGKSKILYGQKKNGFANLNIYLRRNGILQTTYQYTKELLKKDKAKDEYFRNILDAQISKILPVVFYKNKATGLEVIINELDSEKVTFNRLKKVGEGNFSGNDSNPAMKKEDLIITKKTSVANVVEKTNKGDEIIRMENIEKIVDKSGFSTDINAYSYIEVKSYTFNPQNPQNIVVNGWLVAKTCVDLSEVYFKWCVLRKTMLGILNEIISLFSGHKNPPHPKKPPIPRQQMIF